MFIKSLKLQNFRNYTEKEIKFTATNNIIYGSNAIGKTNILEAIYMLSLARSHRNAKDVDMIKFGENYGVIRGEFESYNRIYNEEIKIYPNKKKNITFNKVPIRKISEMMGMLNVVIFCPEDLKIVKGSPTDRRRMIDLAICQYKRGYLSALSDYNKVLDQRNKLLKEGNNKNIEKSLWVWDKKLAEYGAVVAVYRQDYLNKISAKAKIIQNEISNEDIELIYQNGFGIKNCSNIKELEQDFEEVLRCNNSKDRKFKITNCGTHRDDFYVKINGVNSKNYASQGQQRTIALAIKLAEAEVIKEITNEHPILLLDDVLSELDNNRQEYVLSKIKELQVIITATNAEKFENIKNLNKILIK